MKISIAPVPYYWDRNTILDFYKKVQLLPVDIVYLGETICSKRRVLDLEDWLEIADALTSSGKEAVMSTLALIEAESELSYLKRITGINHYKVEANDISAVQLLSGNTSFVIGPHINVYNDRTLSFLHELGARRWVVPVELQHQTVTDVLLNRPPDLEVEITGYGRLPLAFSARCFSARAYNLAKDECGFVCSRHEDGLLLETQDGQPVLVINGIQLQSSKVQNLVGYLTELVSTGIDIFRIVPRKDGIEETVNIIRRAMDRSLSPDVAAMNLENSQPFGCCNGYFNGNEGIGWYS